MTLRTVVWLSVTPRTAYRTDSQTQDRACWGRTGGSPAQRRCSAAPVFLIFDRAKIRITTFTYQPTAPMGHGPHRSKQQQSAEQALS